MSPASSPRVLCSGSSWLRQRKDEQAPSRLAAASESKPAPATSSGGGSTAGGGGGCTSLTVGWWGHADPKPVLTCHSSMSALCGSLLWQPRTPRSGISSKGCWLRSRGRPTRGLEIGAWEWRRNWKVPSDAALICQSLPKWHFVGHQNGSLAWKAGVRRGTSPSRTPDLPLIREADGC